MTEPTLWMLIGLPGSGKSTWAQRLGRGKISFLIVSTDQIRAQLYGDEGIQGRWAEIWQQVIDQFTQGLAAIQAGTVAGILYDATNTQRRGRREVLQTARSLGYTRFLAVWIDVPMECCLQRNAQRSRQVPPGIIEGMARRLEAVPPHLDEGFDAIFQLR
jgi:predicted kinase